MKKLLVAVCGASLLLTACATTNTTTNNAQTRNSVIGSAAIGAAIGALSQVDDGDRRDIGKAAAVGAVVGAGAGYATTR